MHQLLTRDSDIFNEPKDHQTLDHVIPLKEGAEPINLRPYRYSHDQKTAIAKLVDEMLAAAVIRPSSSPFQVRRMGVGDCV
jgi:hypothetical protein